MTDEDLLNAVSNDPEFGISEVVARCGEQLLGRLRKYARDKRYGDSEVEDVFQRGLMRLLDPDIRKEIMAVGGEILPFLSRWGYWRLDESARRQAVGAQKSSAPVARMQADPSPTTQAVRAAIDQLRPRDRTMLRWRYENSLTNAEVADHLGISEGAAKKAVHDARERVRKLLESAGIRFK